MISLDTVISKNKPQALDHDQENVQPSDETDEAIKIIDHELKNLDKKNKKCWPI